VAASGINLNILPDSSLSFEGTAGQLFSISDGLAFGTIFSVNDISGMPSIEVDASGLLELALAKHMANTVQNLKLIILVEIIKV
jgi:hypothetical protein